MSVGLLPMFTGSPKLFRTRKILFRTRKKLGIVNNFRFLEFFAGKSFYGIIGEFGDDPGKVTPGIAPGSRSRAGIQTGIVNDSADPRGDRVGIAP